MGKAIRAVRGIDEEVYRKFRGAALGERRNVGEALTEAMKLWVKEKQQMTKKPNQRNLLKLNGIIRAGRKVRWSEEVDEVLYGRPS